MVTKSFLPPLNEYVQEIERIWSSHWLTNNGHIHNDFESKLSEYLNVEHIALLTNGHLALETALRNLDLEGEVITTPFTFVSTTHAIVNAGLTPVFCDIDINTYNIDVSKIESLITEKTTAILPVHVFGNPCDVEAIDVIAKKYGLKVIYDAAHAFGVEISGRSIASFGDISMFSLHATKIFHSIEGGVLATNNGNHKKLIELYKNFGISGPEDIELIGINAKMNEFQAAMGLINLRYIENHIEVRKKITNLYKRNLLGVPGLSFLGEMQNVKYNYSYLPVLVDPSLYGRNRNELHEKLKEYNIFTRKYFYPLVNDATCYKGKLNSVTPVARVVAENILTLPIYSTLELEDADRICNILKQLAQ
ncbi:MAG TPA: DegT/DnrJ/EryC1/StrS family aminotransferase [Candidatus Paenibacillus intestinavium]|nr:DegT/DnrJ/EryC1/StrS family aminotransferase [Candidatus Paenibacillus intestinavium]